MSTLPIKNTVNPLQDLPEVSKLAITVWKAYKNTPDKLRPLSQELASLHIVLKEAESQVQQNVLDTEIYARMEAMLRDTREVLEDLELFRTEVMSASLDPESSTSAGGASSREEDLEELKINVASKTHGILAILGNIMNSTEQDPDKISRRTSTPSSDETEAQLGEMLQQKIYRRRTLTGAHSSQPSASTSNRIPVKKDRWKELFDELRRVGVLTDVMNEHRDQIIKCYNGVNSVDEDPQQTTPQQITPRPPAAPATLSPAPPSAPPPPPPPAIPPPPPPAIAATAAASAENPPNRRFSKGFTSHWRPLSFFFGPMIIDAAKTGDIEALKTRLRFVSNIDSKDSEGLTALQWASMNGHTEAVKILIAKGADISQSHTGGKALNRAAQNGHLGVVRCLLEHGVDVDSEDIDTKGLDKDDQYSPLLWAATRGHADVVELLLDKDAKTHFTDDDADDKDSCCSALFAAATNGHAGVVHCILDRVPSRKIRNKWQEIVYDITAGSWKYKMGMVQVLIKKGQAHIDDTIDREKRTPLHIAVDRGNLPLVAQILDTGANIEKPDICGMTALHKAVRGGRAEMVHLLLIRGADIAATTSAGSSALHMAVHHPPPQTSVFDSSNSNDGAGQKSSRIVELLLEYGADVFKEDNDGKTPLDHLPNSDPQFTSLVTALLLAEMERVVPLPVPRSAAAAAGHAVDSNRRVSSYRMSPGEDERPGEYNSTQDLPPAYEERDGEGSSRAITSV